MDVAFTNQRMDTPYMTYMDVGSVENAGAFFHHPCRLDGSIHATDSLKSIFRHGLLRSYFFIR